MAIAHPLDNPFWVALHDLHGDLALHAGEVLRYPADIAPFLGIADADVAMDDALDILLPAGDTTLMLGVAPATLSSRWQLAPLETLAQMESRAPMPVIDGPAIVPLVDAAQQADVLDLTTLVYPHYFRPRTMALGRYFGIYLEDGEGRPQLAAMIGERLGAQGFRELSAICTHPGFTGRGLARRLTAWLNNRLLDEGRQPFLHVSHRNVRAKSLYEAMGFTTRRDLPFWALRRA